jgi:tetratricopeptide (TPR) repeat protein
MTRIAFFLTTVVSLAAQTPTPPVAVKPRVLQAPYYERLDIVYRVEPGPRITEIRSGELRVGRSKNLTAPQRNEAGEIQVRELVRIRGGVTEKIEVPAEKTYDEFSWEIPAAEPSDVIRFTVEQRMDLMEAGGDWVSAYALFAYFPVLKGTLRLELPAGFAGTVTSDPLPERGGHEWDLSKDSSSSPEIEVNSFTRWQDVSRWILSQCPARPDPTVSEFARKAAAGAATSAAKVLAVLKALNDEGPIQDARTDSLCHPVEEVFVAALAALEIPTDRFLVAEKAPEAIRLGSLTGSYVRVRAGSEELWFDMNASDQVDGLRLEAGTEAVLPLLATGAAWSAPLVTLPGVRLEPGGMDARLDAGVSSLGKLQGSATFKTVNGSQFLNPEEGRKLGTMTLQVGGERYLLEKDYFLVPVEIRTKTAMGLFKLLNDPVPLPGGGLYLGAPGTYREEIRLEIPKDRRVRTNVNLNVDRPFGRYQSRARVEGSTLVITRELELRRAYAPPEEVTAALALADRMREDQETKFEFQRLGAVDWAQWVEALPPGALNAMAYKAFVNAEHEGGMAVTERAVTLRPEDPYPWRIKGELHMRADERAKALAAFDVAAKFDPAIRNLFLYQSLQLQLGRGEALIQELRGRIERNPKDFDAYRVLANTLTNLKHWAEAEEALTVAQQSPDFPAAQRQGLAAALAVIRVCAGTSLDPETELRNVGTTRSAVLQLNAMVALVGC